MSLSCSRAVVQSCSRAVVQPYVWTSKKCTKKRAEQLFCLLNQLFLALSLSLRFFQLLLTFTYSWL